MGEIKIQATYRHTGITPRDAIVRAKNKNFKVRPREEGRCVMLFPKQYPNGKIQISRYAANVWIKSFDELDYIEDLLNRTFGDRFNLKPFKEPDILFSPKELRNILETPLGIITTFAYYHPRVIADAVYQAVQNNWDKLGLV